jgi:hypothetical protein
VADGVGSGAEGWVRGDLEAWGPESLSWTSYGSCLDLSISLVNRYVMDDTASEKWDGWQHITQDFQSTDS